MQVRGFGGLGFRVEGLGFKGRKTGPFHAVGCGVLPSACGTYLALSGALSVVSFSNT